MTFGCVVGVLIQDGMGPCIDLCLSVTGCIFMGLTAYYMDVLAY